MELAVRAAAVVQAAVVVRVAGVARQRVRLGRQQSERLQRHEYRTGRQPERIHSFTPATILEQRYFGSAVDAAQRHHQFHRSEHRITPDFGAGLYQGSNMGIPYVVVGGTQAR